MKKQVPKNVKVVRYVYLVLTVFLLSLILLWGRNSFYSVYRLERKVAKTQSKVDATTAQNDSLRSVNNSLKTDPDVAEVYAREQHGLIRDDEVVWRFKPAREEQVPEKKGKGE